MWFSKATTHSTDAGVGHGEQWPDGQQNVFWSIKGSVVGRLHSLCPPGNVTEGYLVLTCQRDHPGHGLSPPFSALTSLPAPVGGLAWLLSTCPPGSSFRDCWVSTFSITAKPCKTTQKVVGGSET